MHQRECNTVFCPPEQIQVITHIKHVPVFKVKSFLHQKYELERLTVNQIAALTMSSRSTIIKYLREAQIPLRPEEHRLGRLRYGERKVNGRIVKNQAEIELMKRIKALKSKGLSDIKIAELLNELGLQTKRCNKWSRRTVYTILKKFI